jgi:hypothetical protein
MGENRKKKISGVDPGGDHLALLTFAWYEPLVDLSGFLNESDPDHQRCASHLAFVFDKDRNKEKRFSLQISFSCSVATKHSLRSLTFFCLGDDLFDSVGGVGGEWD